jgi:quinol monooxygenase YgiN
MADADGVTITFEMGLKPEAVALFLQAAPGMMTETAAFPGCQAVRIVQHKDDPTRLLFVERWDSEEAYGKYIAWRMERGDFESLGPMLTSTETNVWPTLIAQT